MSDASLLVVLIALFAYFLPAMVAYHRRHHNTAAIFILNLLLGWTGLGWVVALIWAATAVQAPAGDRQQP